MAPSLTRTLWRPGPPSLLTSRASHCVREDCHRWDSHRNPGSAHTSNDPKKHECCWVHRGRGPGTYISHLLTLSQASATEPVPPNRPSEPRLPGPRDAVQTHGPTQIPPSLERCVLGGSGRCVPSPLLLSSVYCSCAQGPLGSRLCPKPGSPAALPFPNPRQTKQVKQRPQTGRLALHCCVHRSLFSEEKASSSRSSASFLCALCRPRLRGRWSRPQTPRARSPATSLEETLLANQLLHKPLRGHPGVRRAARCTRRPGPRPGGVSTRKGVPTAAPPASLFSRPTLPPFRHHPPPT